MAQPIMVVASIKSVTTKKSSSSTLRERTIVYEGSSGPRELLESIVIQATAAMKSLEGMNAPEQPAGEGPCLYLPWSCPSLFFTSLL